jgi:hypothetical protein
VGSGREGRLGVLRPMDSDFVLFPVICRFQPLRS